MKRAKWKGPFIPWSLFRWIKNSNQTNRVKVIWSRNAIILPAFVGNTFLIHSGHQFKKILINSEIVNFKFGEFVPTRRQKQKK